MKKPSITQLETAREWLDTYEGHPDEDNYQDITEVNAWLTHLILEAVAEKQKKGVKLEVADMLSKRHNRQIPEKYIDSAWKLWKKTFCEKGVELYRSTRKLSTEILRKELDSYKPENWRH